MSVRSAQTVVYEFTTSHPTTGAATTADSLPVGTLILNGADNAAVVTVTLVDTGRYKFSVILPTLAAGDGVEVYISATVNAVAGKGIVWRDTKDVLLDGSGGVTFNNTSLSGAVGSVTAGVTVTTNNDKTGYSLTVAPPTAAQNADGLLIRNLAGGSDGGRTVQDSLRVLRNRWVRSGGTLTVYAEDDTTVSWTSTITISAINPVSESHPT